jgi:hypothetical protein
MTVLTDIAGQELDLMPTETLMRAHPEELRGIVRLGTPDVFDAVAFAGAAGTALDPGVELLAASNDFSLVRLPLSVRPRGDMQVRFLALECALHGEGGETVCWSLAPERIENEVTVSAGSKVSAGLTVGVFAANAEASGNEDLVVYQPHITAFGLGSSELAWELQPTKGREVRGVQMLHFIARTSKGARAECSVRLRLDVRIKRLLWNTVAVAEDGSTDVARFAVAPG